MKGHFVYLTYDRGTLELQRKRPDDVLLNAEKTEWRFEGVVGGRKDNHWYKIGADSRDAFPAYMLEGTIFVMPYEGNLKVLKSMLEVVRERVSHSSKGSVVVD